MLYGKRKLFRNFEENLGRIFAFMSPNQWSLLTIIPASLTFYFLFKNNFLLASIFILITFMLDLIDGSVARFTGRETRFGAYLDTVIDRYVEFAVIFGLFVANLPSFIFSNYVWISLFLFGSLMTTYTKSAAIEKGLVKNLVGGIERAERGILLFLGVFFAQFQRIYLTYIIIILAIATNLSALHRFFIAMRRK